MDKSTDQPPAGFKRPFHYDGISYIWDVNGEMAADFGSNWTSDGSRRINKLRARGWGYIQYIPQNKGYGERSGPEAGALMDKWQVWLLAKANGSNDPETVVQRLNKVEREEHGKD